MRFPTRLLPLIAAITLALAGTVATLSLPAGASLAGREQLPADETTTPPVPSPSPTPEVTGTPSPPETFYQLLPLIQVDRPPHVELLAVGATDNLGIWRSAFLPDEPLTYTMVGRNNLSSPVTASLRIARTGVCESGEIFSGTLLLPSGGWQFNVPSGGLGCVGVYTTTAALTYETLSPTLSAQHVVNEPSGIRVSEHHGFDRCRPPTVEEMQSWWDGSPYWFFNLYLGGESFFCSDTPLDAVWVHQVAQQGWTFLLAWVGPQAPCSGYTHKMSADPAIAYMEGRVEAAAAATAAWQLGFFGDQVIFNDVEVYATANATCREAVSAFMRGWTEELHDRGLQAGGYGAACSSYVWDWAENEPPPDDVWLAHWYLSGYTETASVWDTPCVSDELWADHQRIKQYAGDHAETWNNTTMVIDSNVADGEVTFLPVPPGAARPSEDAFTLQRYGVPLDDLGLFGPDRGWATSQGRLLRTSEGEVPWTEITPRGLHVLDADFSSSQEAWAVGVADSGPSILVAKSGDGGESWHLSTLPAGGEGDLPVATAYLEVTDEQSAWVALKLPSGSAFSRGQLYFSGDGGRTWEPRELPIGAPVHFLDAQRGWTAGGPAGDQLFITQDGGRTWDRQPLEIPAGSRLTLGEPRVGGDGIGRLAGVLHGPEGLETAIYVTEDAGLTWRLTQGVAWSWQDYAERLLAAGARSLPGGGTLPPGTVELDFFNEDHGWALAREGHCTGEKSAPPPSGEAFTCRERWLLLATANGGHTWRELDISAVQTGQSPP